jgi:replicative DNA helicase
MNEFKKNQKEISVDNYLPHNFLAEKTLLSCLLINSEAVEITIKTLPIEAFYFKNHQEIYKAIIFMTENKLPIDIVTLTTFLQEKGLLDKTGGIGVLIELISQIPNLTYLEEYIRLVKDKFVRRSLIKLGYRIINSGYITNLPLETMLNNLEIELFNLTNEIKKEKSSNTVQLLTDIFYELKEKFLNPTLPGLASGFSNLDQLTQGFQKSDLIIIAGRPSMGKTALSLNITLNVIKNVRLPVLFFTLEMSKQQIMYRLLSLEAKINQTRLKTGKLYESDWLKLNKIIKIIAKAPLFIDDTANLSVQEIRSKIKTIILEQNQIGLVVIDYLQLMQNSKIKNENRVQELSQITRSLKTIAKEFNVPIIALSQLSRNVENRIDQKPILSDLRESGSIEQDADLVLMLYRPKSAFSSSINHSSSQLIELIIAKHRNGPIGTVKLKFDEKLTKFVDNQET